MHKRTSHGEDILPEAEAQLFAQEQGDGGNFFFIYYLCGNFVSYFFSF